MCSNRSQTVSNQHDSLCNRRDCELRKKGGVWICCTCEFGYMGSDRNRYGRCSGCNHAVCEDCKKWTVETAAELLRTNTAKDSSGEDKASSAEESEAKESSSEEDNGSQTVEQARESEDNDDEGYGQRNESSPSGSAYSPSSDSDGDDDD